MRIWPDRIERALLIAPDGIKLNFWYRLATGSAPARRLFRYTIHNPYFFLKLLDWAGKFRLIHPATGRFALSQMRNDAKREKVYSTWVVFRSLHSRVDQLIAIIRQYKLPVLVFAGEKDSVIGLKPLEEFAGKAENSRLVLLPVNHQQLIDSTATWVRDHHGIF
jgi:pimeloyl-ACP methyl ester carboxylesterase